MFSFFLVNANIEYTNPILTILKPDKFKKPPSNESSPQKLPPQKKTIPRLLLILDASHHGCKHD
jgi:hypothetical protein